MLHLIRRLFQRYADCHQRVSRTGRTLIDDEGRDFGLIEQIELRGRALHVSGYAQAGRVGLSKAGHCVETITDAAIITPFRLEILYDDRPAVFWAEIADNQHTCPLPPISKRDLRAARRALWMPFCRDGLRVFPAALHWLIFRDEASAARVARQLGLGGGPEARRLTPEHIVPANSVTGTAPKALPTAISIVLPIYNALDLLPEVLRRAMDYTDLPFRLILIEDGSSDDRVQPWLHSWLAALDAAQRARVTLLENGENMGFVQSVNRAFEAALPFGDHVVLLNSDAFVPPGWASRLIRPMLDDAQVASVTPMSNDAEIFSVPVICSRAALQPGQGDRIDAAAMQFVPADMVAEAPTGVGFCMAMHIDFLRQLPQFDTAFGRGYGEEVDWCQRARALGGRHLGLAGLFVEHRGGASFGSEAKQKLVQRNNKIILTRYRKYDADVAQFIRDDPLLTPRLALAMAWAASQETGPVPIYLAHSLGGGAEAYLENRIADDIAHGGGVVVLRVGGASRWQVELHSPFGVTRGQTDDTALMRRLLDILPARKVIYSCGVGDRDPVELPALLLSLATSDDAIEVLLHDYFPLSPSYTLLNRAGHFTGVPVPGTDTDPAHSLLRPGGDKVGLEGWCQAWGKLLHRAGAVTVFSENSRELLLKAYPEIAGRVRVTPHALLYDVLRIKADRPAENQPVIGVLGNIGPQKGAAVLQTLSEHLAQNGAAQLVVVGTVNLSFSLASPTKVHGTYQRHEIPGLIEDYGITCWLMPSVWPETFSYTTHEMLATGLPVWSFDLGAQGDAVRSAVANGQGGGLLPLDASPEDIISMITHQQS